MSVIDSRLDRFVRAQEGAYAQALSELQAGLKQSHWVWYVLPQLRGLGHSPMAHEFGIDGRAEAAAYLGHPVLGPRLVECVHALLAHRHRSAVEILGQVDAMKFRSCLTLFSQVAAGEPCFDRALQAFYGGEPDTQTLRLLEGGGEA